MEGRYGSPCGPVPFALPVDSANGGNATGPGSLTAEGSPPWTPEVHALRVVRKQILFKTVRLPEPTSGRVRVGGERPKATAEGDRGWAGGEKQPGGCPGVGLCGPGRPLGCCPTRCPVARPLNKPRSSRLPELPFPLRVWGNHSEPNTFISHELNIKPKDFIDLVLAHGRRPHSQTPAAEPTLPGKSEKHGKKGLCRWWTDPWNLG